jgi:hypothetical protein
MDLDIVRAKLDVRRTPYKCRRQKIQEKTGFYEGNTYLSQANTSLSQY